MRMLWSLRQMPADQIFGIAVGRRRVDVADPRLDRARQDCRDLTFIGAPAAIGHAVVLTELHGAKTETRRALSSRVHRV